MKGKFKRQHQIHRHLWKGFLFFQSLRARRLVHAEHAESLLARAGRLVAGMTCLQAESRLLASNHIPKLDKSFKHINFQKMDLPFLAACIKRHIQCRGLLSRRLGYISSFSYDGPSPGCRVVCCACLCCCFGPGLSKDGDFSPRRD